MCKVLRSLGRNLSGCFEAACCFGQHGPSVQQGGGQRRRVDPWAQQVWGPWWVQLQTGPWHPTGCCRSAKSWCHQHFASAQCPVFLCSPANHDCHQLSPGFGSTMVTDGPLSIIVSVNERVGKVLAAC